MKKLKKNEKIAVFVSLAIILFFFAGASIVGFISQGKANESKDNTASLGELKKEVSQTSSITQTNGMTITDIIIGTGEEAVPGKILTVHYTGTLTDGTKFDSSLDRGQPFRFILGAGQVIKGWENGFAGMKVGGKRRLIIPSELGYSDRQIGSIPANSTLLFEVELLAVEDQR